MKRLKDQKKKIILNLPWMYRTSVFWVLFSWFLGVFLFFCFFVFFFFAFLKQAIELSCFLRASNSGPKQSQWYQRLLTTWKRHQFTKIRRICLICWQQSAAFCATLNIYARGLPNDKFLDNIPMCGCQDLLYSFSSIQKYWVLAGRIYSKDVMK